MPRILGGLFVVAALIGGCAHAPKAVSERTQLEMDASRSLQAMINRDPGIQSLIAESAGYMIFPDVKQGGFVVGGAGGKGVLYEGGRPTGFVQLSQASVGAQIGGQTYSELVVVRDKFTLDKIRSGDVDLGAEAGATILRAGAATGTRFGESGVAVVIDPKGGAMLNLSLTGQVIRTTG